MTTTTTTNPGPAVTVSAHPQNVTTNQTLRLLAVLKGVNANNTAALPMQVINSTNYSVKSLIVTNLNNAGAAVTPTGLALGVATTSGGSTLFGAITAANLATTNGIYFSDALAQAVTASGPNLYLNITAGLTTPVVGATIDVYVYGYDFS